jgi:outer membrane lipoprotein-sorting protein
MMKLVFFLSAFLFFTPGLRAQSAPDLLKTIRDKLGKIDDYQAAANLKTNIPFLAVPDAEVRVYYKKPNRIKIKNEKGISLVPKESVSISLYSLLSGQYQVLDAGSGKIGNIPVRIIKLLPENENADLVLATLYIDAARLLVLKAKITTRENGTDEVTMTYGKYAAASLPDKIIFSFNTREYKLPKGVTFDYDDGSRKKKPEADQKNQRGKIEISYYSYEINKGLGEEVFK